MESFNLSYNTKSIWHNVSKKQFTLHTTDSTYIQLGPGDCIIWEGRNDYVTIVDVIGDNSTPGPQGFIYLPWRNEGRWASRMFSLRGDPRYVICYPGGELHYGTHIPLHTIRKDEVPLLNMETSYTRISNNCIAPLRFEINKQCSLHDLTCTIVDENTYYAAKDDLQVEIKLFQFETTCSNYLLNIKKRSGCEHAFQDFIIDFNITEYPLS